MKSYGKLNVTLVHNLKKKIEELKQSEEKFRVIFEGDRDGILVADAKTKKFLSANPAICKMLGYSEKELLQFDISKIHPKKDLPYVTEQFTKQLKGEIEVAENLPVLRKDRTVFFCDINSAPSKISRKDVLIGFFKDITERKNAEKELRQSEEKYRTIVESATDQIFLLDTQMRFVSINKVAASMSHHLPEELIGKSIYDIFPKETVIRFSKNCKEVLKTGKNKFIEEKMVVNGMEFYNNTNLNPVKDREGNVVAVMGIVRDVTEQKSAEEKIKESGEKFRVLFETSSDAIMTLEPPKWNFTSGNPATVKMFKAKNEKDFTSRCPWELSPKYQPDRTLSSVKAKKMIMKAMKEGSNFFEWTHRRINGEDFPATVLLTRVTVGGKTFLQATVRDITEKNQTEQKLKESEERYRTFADNAPEIIQSVFSDGSFNYVNKEWKKVLGYSDRNIKTMKIWSIIPKEHVKLCMKYFKKVMAGHKLTGIHTAFLSKNKKPIALIGDINPVKHNGKVIETIGVFHRETKSGHLLKTC